MARGKTEIGDNRREEILSFIVLYKSQYGVSPSVSEISQGVGVNRGSVQYHLGVLVEEDRLSRTSGHRDISIPGELYFTPDKAKIWSRRIKGALSGSSDPLKLLNDLDRLFEAT